MHNSSSDGPNGHYYCSPPFEFDQYLLAAFTTKVKYHHQTFPASSLLGCASQWHASWPSWMVRLKLHWLDLLYNKLYNKRPMECKRNPTSYQRCLFQRPQHAIKSQNIAHNKYDNTLPSLTKCNKKIFSLSNFVPKTLFSYIIYYIIFCDCSHKIQHKVHDNDNTAKMN